MTTRDERIQALEEAALAAGLSPERWLELGALLLRAGREARGLEASERGIWGLDPSSSRRALAELDWALGDVDAEDSDLAARLYRQAFACRKAAEEPGLDDALGELLPRLRSEGADLRVRSRWLLWLLVVELTGDREEEERQRRTLLSRLALQGRPDEREAPAFVRAWAATAPGRRTRPQALDLLEQAELVGEAVRHPALRAMALAEVAWSYVGLGESLRALQAADEAERAWLTASMQGPPLEAARAAARARLGAVRERVSGNDAGYADLEGALDGLTGLLAHSADAAEAAESPRALAAWFAALADARQPAPRPHDPLLLRGLTVLEAQPEERRARILAEAAPALRRLGCATQARLLGGDLLGTEEDLDLARRGELLLALAVVGADGRAPPEDARRYLARVETTPGQLDHAASAPLTAALAVLPVEAAGEVAALAERLRAEGLGGPALVLRLAVLERLAAADDHLRVEPLLRVALAEAWDLSDAVPERPLLLRRAVGLVPALRRAPRDARVLRDVLQRSRSEEPLYLRNELLQGLMAAAAQLDDAEAGLSLIEELVQEALRLRDQADPAQPSWLLFEALAEASRAAVGAAREVDTARVLAITSTVAEAARAALEELGPDATTPARYFCAQALVACGEAAAAMGAGSLALEWFSLAAAQLERSGPDDLADLSRSLVEAATGLEGALRWDLSRQSLEALRGRQAERLERHTADLIAVIGREVVLGAGGALLDRWLRRDLPRLRARIAHERLLEPLG